MNPAANAVTALSEEQQTIVDASPTARLLVLAGAGAGKTHVLVERIRRLVEDHDVAPGRELLVMSFTRAAVAEVRTRIGTGQGRARLVRPVTFDSFATRVLAAHSQTTNWREMSYDGRIAAATELLEGERGSEALAEFRHVFVDEIQDLVGVRASLVDTVVRRIDAFTLLGDPAQAIYDHQVRDRRDATTSQAFLTKIVREHPTLQTLTLSGNLRSSTPETAEVDRVGAELRQPTRRLAEVAREIAEIYRNLEPLGSFDDLAPALRGARDRIAVLCRANDDTLRISKTLALAGVDHRLRGEATDIVLPRWLATLFDETERSSWSERRLTALAEDRLGDDAPPAEDIWRLLSDTVGSDDVVDLAVLRRNIAARIVADELAAPEASNVIVSTIHRAKGLEFDVVFTPTPTSSIEDEDDLEELRVLYVALSRAREQIWTFPEPANELWYRDPSCRNRWVKSPWRDRSQTLSVEIRPDDLDAARPVGAGLAATDVRLAQEHLRGQVARCDTLRLELLHVRETSDGEIPFYAAMHGATIVGETNEAFGFDLASRLRRATPGRWPLALVGATIASVETVIGLASEGQAHGLGASGMWLRPRAIGLGDLVWEDGERPA